MNQLHPIYIYPENGAINPGEVKRILEENPNVKIVVITSPTYEGVVSDVERIAGIVHEKGIPLIMDEAHGAHFGFLSVIFQRTVIL